LLKIKLFRAIAIGNTDEKDIAPKPLLARSLAPTSGAGSLVNSGGFERIEFLRIISHCYRWKNPVSYELPG